MTEPIRILLQTTITAIEDDWHVGRFSMLRDTLAGLRDPGGAPMIRVTARDRDSATGPDPVLSTLDESDYDQLWLFAVDTGEGLDSEDCAAISRFRKKGGGLMVTRDHMDLGSSVCTLGGVGEAHYFHSRNPEPDPDRHCIDDSGTPAISWPNYHSGANGDFQGIEIVGELHPVLMDPQAEDGVLRYLPAHPHEGAVGAPPADPSARVIATGRSSVTGRRFNIAVAFEPSEAGGRPSPSPPSTISPITIGTRPPAPRASSANRPAMLCPARPRRADRPGSMRATSRSGSPGEAPDASSPPLP